MLIWLYAKLLFLREDTSGSYSVFLCTSYSWFLFYDGASYSIGSSQSSTSYFYRSWVFSKNPFATYVDKTSLLLLSWCFPDVCWSIASYLIFLTSSSLKNWWWFKEVILHTSCTAANFWRLTGKWRAGPICSAFEEESCIQRQSSSRLLTVQQAPSLKTSEWCCSRHLSSFTVPMVRRPFLDYSRAPGGTSRFLFKLIFSIEVMNWVVIPPSESLLKLDSFVASWLSSAWITSFVLCRELVDWLMHQSRCLSRRRRLPKRGVSATISLVWFSATD